MFREITGDLAVCRRRGGANAPFLRGLDGAATGTMPFRDAELALLEVADCSGLQHISPLVEEDETLAGLVLSDEEDLCQRIISRGNLSAGGYVPIRRDTEVVSQRTAEGGAEHVDPQD